MSAQQTKSAKVARVTKAIAQARGTDDVSLAGSTRSNNVDLMQSEVDDYARDGIRLSFLIHDVSRMRRSAYDHYMKPLGITRAQWWVLAHLSRHDGMMQTQLADVLEVGKASLGDVIESLESGGWVSRRPDPTDKRAKRVYLSKSSQGLIKRMTQLEVEFNEKVLADLPPDEQATLFKLLLKVKQSISRISTT